MTKVVFRRQNLRGQLLVLRNRFEIPARDVVARHAFTLRSEIGDDAVAKHWWRDGSHIVATYISLTAEDGASLGGENQIQPSARTGAPREPFVAEIECFGSFGTSRANQTLGV